MLIFETSNPFMCTPEIMLLFNVLYAVNIKKQIIKMLSTIIINKLKIVKNISENRDSNVKNYNVINDSIRQLKQSLINIRKKIPRLTD